MSQLGGKILAIVAVLAAIMILLVVAISNVNINRGNDTEVSDIQSQDDAGRQIELQSDVPQFLKSNFPDTDFDNSSVNFSEILSGGPGKDGIPAISEPVFVPVSDTEINSQVRALVYVGESEVRAYPYNILNWHEIVNDEIDGVPIAVTFCPLCGSAIVFNRTTSQGVADFGVSGALRESNMIMYDRNTESLWQQSTGQAIVGQLNGEQLQLEPFQLLTVAEVSSKYPGANILSQDTGYSRDYNRNPYSAYEGSEDFIFEPSFSDNRYPSKEIFVIYNVDGFSIATPSSAIADGQSYNYSTQGRDLSISREGGEVFVEDAAGQRIPHYFEMWFSWAVQHQDNAENKSKSEVFDPSS